MSEDVLDVRGVAEMLGVSRDVVYAMCAAGRMPHARIGRVIRFSREAVVRWLASCGQQDASKEST